MQRMLTVLAALANLGGGAMLASGVQAASFDCVRAGTSFETAICGDPKLSASDDTLMVSYQTAIGGLSAPAVAAMQASQRAWLELAERACTSDGEPAKVAYDADGVSCLRGVFEQRGQLLENSRMLGGLRFYNGEAFATAFDPAGSFPPVATKMSSTPRLDGDSAQAKAFNDFIAAQAVGLIGAGPGSADFDVTSDDWDTMQVTGVNAARITVADHVYHYPHGADHGSFVTSHVHFLREQQRALKADDIFAGTAWKKTLLDLAYKGLQAELGDNLQLAKADDIANVVTDPSRWNFSDAGLAINFQPYEVASYEFASDDHGTPTVMIPWSALADDMTPDADAIARY